MPASTRVSEDDAVQRHLDKVGVGGALFTALCCLGFPALLSILSAVGLGFLIKDAILLPLLLFFLIVTLVGLYFGLRRHNSPWALVLGAASAVITFVFIAFIPSKFMAGLGIAGLIAASILNVWLRARQIQQS